MSKFSVGQRVCRKFTQHNQYEDDREYGKIVGTNVDNGKYFFKSEWNWRQNATYEVAEENLLTEEEAETLFNQFEAEFEKITSEVAAQIQVAAEALAKAEEIASAANYTLSELDAARPLMRAMEKCGWNTSSLSC